MVRFSRSMNDVFSFVESSELLNACSHHAVGNVSKEGERVSIAPSANDRRRPEPRPDVDRSKDPDRPFLAAHDRGIPSA
jgi:hypothetical protein